MSLIPSKIVNGVELYLVLNKPVFKPGEEAKLHILAQGERGRKIPVEVISEKNVVFSGEVHADSELAASIIVFNTPEKPGVYKITARSAGSIIDEVSYMVYSGEQRAVKKLAFVWHNHQAPNYLPDNTIHSPWAYTYLYSDILKPYGKAPYSYHVEMLERHGDYHATFNLSPSLLKQWDVAVKQGVVFESGERISPGDEKATAIKNVIDRYRDAFRRGQIDVLTSIYAHTIGGFLIDVLGMEDVVRDEVKHGVEVTWEVLGVEPLGAWTPEMAFSMRMVDIYYDNEIEYTILDEKCHFEGAEGRKASIYEPYIALNKDSGKHIVSYFRDNELSNILSFKNNFKSEAHALRNAYEAAFLITRKAISAPGRIMTLALDGENWMTFSSNPPLTAFYYDKLLVYLETAVDAGIIKLASLREIHEEVPATRILTKIPTNTWLCSFKKWRGEKPEHEEYWLKAVEAHEKIKAYESMINGRDSFSEKARWALWHALDSDYWWAEFWSPRIIDTWLNEAVKHIEPRLKGLEVRNISIPGQALAGMPVQVKVDLENKLESPLKVTVKVSCPGRQCFNEKIVEVPGNTTASTVVEVVFEDYGPAILTISVVSASYTLYTFTKEITVHPRIPPSPF